MLVNGQINAAHRQPTEAARNQEQQKEGGDDDNGSRLFDSDGREIILIFPADMFISHDS